MMSWARLGVVLLLGFVAVGASAAPTNADHDEEHGALLDDHMPHEPESKEKLRSMFKEQKDRQGEIKANLTSLKNELRDLKNRLRTEKQNGNSAKASELRALIKKKKRDFVAMKEEKKTAQRAKNGLKIQLKSAKAAGKQQHAEDASKSKEDRREKKKSKKNKNKDEESSKRNKGANKQQDNNNNKGNNNKKRKLILNDDEDDE